ncbi:MAG: GUN4 domain-containing protein [Oscillatoriales cyanobacterium RM2_1_1]|nr:GUN4 domain-containing protein [Oscillatoriales cyanobacterium SM2_3_0]NJO46205.1 GUN4 domain-containing protein [Oscillatoriales cyanobacterium RM2_1_1]
MDQCPICESQFDHNLTESCSTCGWLSKPALLSEDVLEAEKIFKQKRLDWAKHTWQQLQKLKQVIPETRSPTEIRFKYHLVKKLATLETQLQQAATERELLKNQLNWVLSHLESINLTELQQTTERLNQWLDSQTSPVLSEVGIDYNPLADLLTQQEWRAADEFTWQAILTAVDRQQQGWLRVEDIEHFPCTDLRTIDQFWNAYSGQRFGLTTQQQIWESSAGDYGTFCDRIGWRERENWRYYEDLNFDINAPEGHLPVLIWRKRACYGIGQGTAAECLTSFIYRLTSCNLNHEPA